MKKYRFSTQVLLNFIFILFAALMFCSCGGGGGGTSSGGSDDTPTPSSAKAITAFSFSSPAVSGIITESTHSIAITVPSGTNVTALIPTIIHTGASINPASGVAQDFTNPVVYTVTAADSSTQDYTVTTTIHTKACNLPVKYEEHSTDDDTIGSVTYYTYDANCRLTKWQTDSFDLGFDLDPFSYVCSYRQSDTDNNKMVGECDSDEDGIIDKFIYVTYDADGKRIKEEGDYDMDGNMDNLTNVFYDTSGRYSGYLTYSDYGITPDEGGPVIYDADGKMIREEISDGYYAGAYHHLDVFYFTEHDANGKPTKQESDFRNDGTIDRVGYYSY